MTGGRTASEKILEGNLPSVGRCDFDNGELALGNTVGSVAGGPAAVVGQSGMPQWVRRLQVPGIGLRAARIERGLGAGAGGGGGGRAEGSDGMPASPWLRGAPMGRMEDAGDGGGGGVGGGKGMISGLVLYERIGRVNQVLCSRRHYDSTSNIQQL